MADTLWPGGPGDPALDPGTTTTTVASWASIDEDWNVGIGGNDSWDLDEPQNYSIDCSTILSSDSIQRATWYLALFYFLYTSIFVIALLGNLLVCYVVYTVPRMRTVTNFFIANLALSDILITILCVPTTFISVLLLQYWPFPLILCPIVSYAQAISVYVSAYTLVAISMDRYMAIKWPLRPRMDMFTAKLVILAIWSFAFFVASPIAIVTKLQRPEKAYETCNIEACGEYWGEGEDEIRGWYYGMAMLLLQYFVPIVLMVFAYASIAVIVWGKETPGEAENSRDQRMAQSKRKMIKMMIVIVIVFSVCWLPLNILNIVIDQNRATLTTWPLLPIVYAFLHWLSMSHACYNPVIYCWMNSRFRTGFLAVLARLPLVRHVVPEDSQYYNTSVAGIPLAGTPTDTRHFNFLQAPTTAHHQHAARSLAANSRNNNKKKPKKPPRKNIVRQQPELQELNGDRGPTERRRRNNRGYFPLFGRRINPEAHRPGRNRPTSQSVTILVQNCD